ncbi:MAG: chemotaxis protein CheA [Armatimonadota bacterium]|nr:chemotaxis protein CheA [Armatimonadota bacterium]MDR7553902.1 chemotaxis protein CheA [Armatimonadota bacterium]MDR7574100.1 chemotaxis protein CheA [Armatimonadota bacterium]
MSTASGGQGESLFRAFLEEAAELVADFESGLLRLEASPDDPEVLHQIFRSAHTLKGNSGMFGLEDMAHFTHALEDLLDELRQGRGRVTRPAIDVLLASADVLRVLLDHAESGTEPSPAEQAHIAATLGALKNVRSPQGTAASTSEACGSPCGGGQPTASSADARPARPTGGRMLYEIRFQPPPDVFRRGLDPLALIRRLGELGELLQVTPDSSALPPLQALEPDQNYLGWTLWLVTDRPREELEACFDFLGEPEAVRLEVLPLDGADTRRPETDGGRDRAAAGSALEPPVVSARARPEAASIRVPVEKVDRLLNLVGEIVITQAMVAEAVARASPERLGRLADAVAQMDRHTRELHERMMALRMVPIRALFGRFPRLVRDLAAAGGKEATLEVMGEDTELDKTLIERIADPLTHLIRNAVDHGLEPPVEREAAGKPRTGRVRLEAYQKGGSIYVEVSDDGRGLDRDRILRRAVAQGLVGPDQALNDEEVVALIFRPGFSTADRLTEISGRGVGMDVVRRNVEALGGTVTVQSEPGRGTRFRIKLPLTLAIMDGQVLRVGEQLYILPLAAIRESVRPTPENFHHVAAARELVTVRGRPLLLVRLHHLFGLGAAPGDPAGELLVIVEHEGEPVALLVDQLLGQQQVVVKSLEANFRRLDGFAGATILGDGRVALILDVPGLIARARATAGVPSGAGTLLKSPAAATDSRIAEAILRPRTD